MSIKYGKSKEQTRGLSSLHPRPEGPGFSLWTDKTHENKNNSGNFNYLADLDKKVVYFESLIDLPNFTASEDNLIIYQSLLNLLEHHSESFVMIPYSIHSHTTRENYIEAFKNVIDSINEPYIRDENDFCAPEPEFFNPIGTLKIKNPDFKDFDIFFNLTKKYVELDKLNLSDKKFSLIVNLAILKTHFQDLLPEKFYQFFREEYKISQAIIIDYKLKPKETQSSIKKPKI